MFCWYLLLLVDLWLISGWFVADVGLFSVAFNSFVVDFESIFRRWEFLKFKQPYAAMLIIPSRVHDSPRQAAHNWKSVARSIPKSIPRSIPKVSQGDQGPIGIRLKRYAFCSYSQFPRFLSALLANYWYLLIFIAICSYLLTFPQRSTTIHK